MNWLFIAIISHFLLAVVFTVDKFLLSKTVLRPAAAAFFVGLLGGAASLFLIPFGFSLMSFWQMVGGFAAGIAFVFAILFFYRTIQTNEVSVVAPIVVPFIHTFIYGRCSLVFLLITCPFIFASVFFWANPAIEQNSKNSKTHKFFFIEFLFKYYTS